MEENVSGCFFSEHSVFRRGQLLHLQELEPRTVDSSDHELSIFCIHWYLWCCVWRWLIIIIIIIIKSFVVLFTDRAVWNSSVLRRCLQRQMSLICCDHQNHVQGPAAYEAGGMHILQAATDDWKRNSAKLWGNGDKVTTDLNCSCCVRIKLSEILPM